MVKQSKRRLLLLMTAFSVGLALWLGFTRQSEPASDWANASPELQALMWPAPRQPIIAGLLGVDQAAFNHADLRGQWNLLYFGYLSCPDVCPTTLQNMRALQSLMRSEQSALSSQMLFVSVDPDNDSAERIDSYLQFFGGSIVGLRAEPALLKPIADSLGVMYAVFVDEAGVRSIDHTSSIIVIDPEGRAVGALPPPHQPQAMLEQLKLLAATQ